MSKLFHYTTWQGREILPLGILRPSTKYLEGGPPLVWLSENQYWEPCIQAHNGGSYERFPSSPELYDDLGIPCWRFEVEYPTLYKLHYQVPGWIPMIQDGIDLGSDVSDWHWITKSVEIIHSSRWREGKWEVAK